MEELLNTTHINGHDDDLIAEFFYDGSPFFVSSQDMNNYTSSPFPVTSLISTDFPAPSIEDFDSDASYGNNFHCNSEARSRMSILEKGLNKIENKYTLKIKICGNSTADDGYKWRKYGQKSIKNSANPRSYYKCTNPRCSAKKQVELSSHENDTFIVTYEGLHLHYTYPNFMFGPDHQSNPPSKKPKITNSKAQAQVLGDAGTKSSIGGPFIGPTESLDPQGLLEDVVPFIIRNPKNNYVYSGSSSSSSSYPSLPDSPSSYSWSPDYSSTLFNLGL